MHDIVSILFGVAGLLVLLGFLQAVAGRLNVPYTVLLAGAGVALGLLAGVLAQIGGPGPFADFWRAISEFNLPAEAYLYLFLPLLLFEMALAIEVRRLLDDLAPILLLAVGAVLVSTFVVGAALAPFTDVGLIACLLVGAILATTDPVAVVGIFRDLGAPRRLAMLIEGESLFNDAAAIVLFTLLYGMLAGDRPADIPQALLAFVWSFGGGIAVGLVMGRLLCVLVTPLRDLPMAEISLTVAFAYLSFIVAQHYAEVSGVVAVVVTALVVSALGRTRISPRTWDGLEQVWKQLGFWASSFVFLLAAMKVPPILLDAEASDLLLGGVLVVAALVARAVVCFGLLPLLTWAGLAHKVSYAFKTVILWGGLRGAVSLALALAIPEDPNVAEEVQDFVAVLATGYVLFTLLVQGTTLKPLIHLLRLDRLSAAQVAIRNRALALALTQVQEHIEVVAWHEGIDLDIAHRATRQYGEKLDAIGRDLVAGCVLEEKDRLFTGLVILINHEESLYRSHFREGIVSRVIVETLITRVGWLYDGARAEGRAGYEAASERATGFTQRMIWAQRIQQRLGLDWPLARRLSVRFEALLVTCMVLRELQDFCRHKLAALLSEATARTLGEVLETRGKVAEKALAALRQHYPDYAQLLEHQYLSRVALRREEAEYEGLRAESLIGQEILNDLKGDLERRRAAVEHPPPLELGLLPAQLVSRVPIFAGLGEDRLGAIARQLRGRLALPDEMLIQRGERGDAMFFICAGTVDVRVPGLATPIHLGSGEFFGEMALLSRQPRNADVRAIGYCHLLELSEADFRRLIEQDQELRGHILATARERKLTLDHLEGGV
ncbi:monovalent cation:H+ antiporter, CPA1 family [uncultured Gammaproteobacteria bacterium]